MTVIGRDESLPQFDLYAPLLSLPRIFKIRSDNIPADVPYLSSDPFLVGQWKEMYRRHFWTLLVVAGFLDAATSEFRVPGLNYPAQVREEVSILPGGRALRPFGRQFLAVTGVFAIAVRALDDLHQAQVFQFMLANQRIQFVHISFVMLAVVQLHGACGNDGGEGAL